MQLLRAIEELENESGGSDWQEQTNQLCAEAIGSFLDGIDVLDLDAVKLRTTHQSPPLFKVGGISVSVRKIK